MNTGDRRSKRSCPRAYLCCKAVANRPSRRASVPSRVSSLATGWSHTHPSRASVIADAGIFFRALLQYRASCSQPRRLPRASVFLSAIGFWPYAVPLHRACGRHRRPGPLRPLQVFACGGACAFTALRQRAARHHRHRPLHRHRRSIHARRLSFVTHAVLRQYANAAPAMMGVSLLSFPSCPRAASTCAPSASPSHRKTGGSLMRGER